MAGLIKGQILKHLSKFVKNLSPSQISLSAIKGEGELSNLELNEVVLTELLELPAWIRLTKASCNRAAIRIQWTKLKTVPIQLQLDEILVSLETCEELRTGETSSLKPGLIQPGGAGAYGFTDKVVDGITVSVNLVYVTVSSLAFTASFQMSRILLESKTPVWKKGNLQMTRLKDLDRGEVLIFKELSWQTVRIEARSTVNKDLTPLRLITNQARCRITIKKRMSDSAILGCRLVLILDDLLWVLTDDQLKAALHFMDSISGLIKKTTTTTQKVKAERKLENQGHNNIQVPKSRGATSSGSTAANTFANYDVFETSYHFYCNRIDLHFCDDPGGGRSLHPDLSQGGAFQVSLSKLQVDYYPYHLARGDRKHWIRYTESSPHRSWINSNLASFDTRLLDVLLSGRNHTPLSRAGKIPLSAGGHVQRGDREDDGVRDIVVKQLARLMTENVVVRLFDLTVYCVATSQGSTNSGTKLREMVKGDHDRLHIPEDLPFLHLEYTSFYYPGDIDFPLPPPCVMVHLNPFTVWLDVLTLIWINAFILNLQKSVKSLQASLDLEQSDTLYADIKLEVVMPRIICGSNIKHKIKDDRKPASLQLHASRISIANYRSLETGSRADLATVLDLFQRSPMFFGAEFPSKDGDTPVVCEKFVSHATGTDCVKEAPTIANMSYTKDLLWTDARDVWYALVDSCWGEFQVARFSQRPVPLIDPVPLAAWVYIKPEEKRSAQLSRPSGDRPSRKLLMQYYTQDENQGKQLHVLAHTTKLVSVQLDHHQLVFVLRLAESLGELAAFLSADTSSIDPVASTVAVGALLPQVDASLILPQGSSTSKLSPMSELMRSPSPYTNHVLSSLGVSETDSRKASLASGKNKVGSGSAETLHTLASATGLVTETSDVCVTSGGVTGGISVTSSGAVSCGASVTSGGALKLEPVIDCSDPLSSSGYSSSCGGNGGAHQQQDGGQTEVSNTSRDSSILLANSMDSVAINSSQVTSSSGSLVTTPQHTSNLARSTPKLNLVPTLSTESVRSETLRAEFSSSRSKGITSSFNSIMDSMRFNKELKSPEMDYDTMSVRSDESGESSMWESEGFVVLNTEENVSDLLFAVHREDRNVSPAELAEEVYEAAEYLQDARLSSPHPPALQESDMDISVLSVHLGKIQFAQLSGSTGAQLNPPKSSLNNRSGENSSLSTSAHSTSDPGSNTTRNCDLNSSEEGSHGHVTESDPLTEVAMTESEHGDPSSILISVGSLVIDQVQNLSWKSFQSRFQQSGKGWSDSALQELDKATVKLRLESRSPLHPHLALQDLPSDLKLSVSERVSRCSDSSIQLEASGLNLELVSSTLAKMSEWAQDEVTAVPPPFNIRLRDIRLRLEDDAPVPPGLPSPPPVLLSIPTLKLCRDRVGVISVVREEEDTSANTQSTSQRPRSEAEKQLDITKVEVELLREQLAQQQLLIKKQVAATKLVQDKLDAKSREVSSMMSERESLLQTLNYLQTELLKTGKK